MDNVRLGWHFSHPQHDTIGGEVLSQATDSPKFYRGDFFPFSGHFGTAQLTIAENCLFCVEFVVGWSFAVRWKLHHAPGKVFLQWIVEFSQEPWP